MPVSLSQLQTYQKTRRKVSLLPKKIVILKNKEEKTKKKVTRPLVPPPKKEEKKKTVTRSLVPPQKEKEQKKKWEVNKSINYVMQECGGGGDCMFLSLAQGINGYLGKEMTSGLELRKMVAECITLENMDELIVQLNDVYSVLSRDKMQKLDEKTRLSTIQYWIKMPGYAVQGDSLFIEKLIQHPFFKTNRLCIGELVKYQGKSYFQFVSCEQRTHIVILYNLGNSHWQLFTANQDGQVTTAIPIDKLSSYEILH